MQIDDYLEKAIAHEELSDAVLLLRAAQEARRIDTEQHIPPHNLLPLASPSITDSKTRFASPEVMGYCRLISTVARYKYILREWLVFMHRANLHVSPDVLPRLLWLGARFPMMREWVWPVLGMRGVWLAREIKNQNWKWAFTPYTAKIDTLIRQERLYERQFIVDFSDNAMTTFADFCARINRGTVTRNRYVWTQELTRLFLDRFEKLIPQKYDNYKMSGFIAESVLFTSYFSLEMGDEVITRLTNVPVLQVDPKGRDRWIDEIKHLYTFRQAMADVFPK